MQKLQAQLGYIFRQPCLLKQALTHPSIQKENNQRMEFLGDAVLEICISDMLYRRYPNIQEGELTAFRIRLVDERTLSAIGQKLNLGAKLMMTSGEESTGGRERPGTLCDTVESVLAAIYLDGGFDAAKTVVENLYADMDGLIASHGGNVKSEIQEWAQARGMPQPTYCLLETSGPAHKPTFVVEVRIGDYVIASGEGHSKQNAEKAAAAKALEILNKE